MPAEHPLIGPARPEIAEEARSLLVRRWLVLYQVASPGVQIVRLIDAARDLGILEWTTEQGLPSVVLRLLRTAK